MTGVILGAVCAHAIALSLGLLLLAPLQLRLAWGERWAAALACGLPLVAVLAQALAAAGLLRRGALQITAALLLLAAWKLARKNTPPSAATAAWGWLAAAPFLAWLAWQAAQPDTTPPGQDWALAAAHRAVSGLGPLPWDAGAVYAIPYVIGRHSAVALFHASLLAPLAAALGRFGWLAMLLAAANPALLSLGAHAGTALCAVLGATAAASLGALAVFERQRRALAASLLAALGAWLCWPPPLSAFPGFVFLKSPWWLVPPLAAAAAWLVQPVRAAAAALAVFAALTGWPPVTELIAPPGVKPPALTGLVEARFLEVLPREAVVLSEVPMPGAWTARRLAPAEWLEHARRAALGEWGVRTLTYRRGGEVRPGGFVGEVLVYWQGREVPRDPSWRVWPAEAFDGLPFTGASGPIRLDLGGGPEEVELRLIGDRGEPWTPPAGLRRNVVLEWRRRGVTHVLARDSLMTAEFTYLGQHWGTALVGERNGAWLYALQ